MKEFLELQKEIAAINEEIWNDPWHSWFSLIEADDLFKIQYYGEGYDDDPTEEHESVSKEDHNYPYVALLELIAANSSKIHSLEFRGPDQGANGVRHWHFQRIIDANCSFPNLESFKVELTDPGFHNICVVCSSEDGYVDCGTIAKLVSKMPSLEELVTPSAPNGEFFKSWHTTSLKEVRIQSGFDSENFIKNYGECKEYPDLYKLDFSDVYFISDIDEIERLATTEQAFEALFSSDAFSSVEYVTLRNTQLSTKQFSRLASMFPELSILVIPRSQGVYAR